MQRRMSELLRLSVDETLNARVEAYGVCGVRRNELSPDRMNPRAGHYDRKFHKQASEVSSSPLSVGISCEKKPILRRLSHLICYWPCCTVHFHHNVFSNVPRNQTRAVAARVKAIHAQESREAAQGRGSKVIDESGRMRLCKAAELA